MDNDSVKELSEIQDEKGLKVQGVENISSMDMDNSGGQANQSHSVELKDNCVSELSKNLIVNPEKQKVPFTNEKPQDVADNVAFPSSKILCEEVKISKVTSTEKSSEPENASRVFVPTTEFGDTLPADIMNAAQSTTDSAQTLYDLKETLSAPQPLDKIFKVDVPQDIKKNEDDFNSSIPAINEETKNFSETKTISKVNDNKTSSRVENVAQVSEMILNTTENTSKSLKIPEATSDLLKEAIEVGKISLETTSKLSEDSCEIPKATSDLSKTTPKVHKTTPEIPKTIPINRKTTPEKSKATPQIPKTTHGIPKAAVEIPQATLGITEIPKAIPGISKVTPVILKATPEISQAIVEIPQATPEGPQAIPEILNAPAEIPAATPEIFESTSKLTKITSEIPDATAELSENACDIPETEKIDRNKNGNNIEGVESMATSPSFSNAIKSSLNSADLIVSEQASSVTETSEPSISLEDTPSPDSLMDTDDLCKANSKVSKSSVGDPSNDASLSNTEQTVMSNVSGDGTQNNSEEFKFNLKKQLAAAAKDSDDNSNDVTSKSDKRKRNLDEDDDEEEDDDNDNDGDDKDDEGMSTPKRFGFGNRGNRRKKRVRGDRGKFVKEKGDPVVLDEETRMELPNDEDSQSSTKKETTNRKFRCEIVVPESTEKFTAEKLIEYQWPNDSSGEHYFIQEHVSEYLGIMSFKRKYPNLRRHLVDMQERDYLKEMGIVSEIACDLGLTAVRSEDVLDVMFTDFPDKFEELQELLRLRHENSIKDHGKVEYQSANLDKTKIHEYSRKAAEDAARWNSTLNKERKEDRRYSFDLQTFTLHLPTSRMKQLPSKYTKQGFYPVAVLPGQYTDGYKEYTMGQLRYLPLNTIIGKPEIKEESDLADNDAKEKSKDGESAAAATIKVEGPKCKVCNHGKEQNKEGKSEPLVVCSSCNCANHLSCIELDPEMVSCIHGYDWKCMECKSCETCKEPHDEEKMIFCDMCDRGYHIYCVGLRRVPNGRWHCKVCAMCFNCGAKTPSGNEYIKNAEWAHEFRKDKGTKKLKFATTLCMPCDKYWKRRQFCYICLKVYRSIPEDGMVRCVTCPKYIHKEVCSTIYENERYCINCFKARNSTALNHSRILAAAQRKMATSF